MMTLCKGFVCSEALRKLLLRHAKSIFGEATSVTCERCNICTINGEDTSFWNIHIVRQSFTINFVLAVFLREVPIRTYVVSNTTN